MTAGDRLADRFVLKQELGRGATGAVWEAWDEAAERPVAVKLLHDGLTGNATGRRALEAEAAAAGRLRHPGVSRSMDCGITRAVDFSSQSGSPAPRSQSSAGRCR